jgi:hypothetical protein
MEVDVNEGFDVPAVGLVDMEALDHGRAAVPPGVAIIMMLPPVHHPSGR